MAEQAKPERPGDTASDPGKSQDRRLALKVEYEGTAYAGFQLQASEPTIQGELERALIKFTGEAIRVRGASRTDAGAHATGQVVDFVTASRHDAATFQRALNYYLPWDIRVVAAAETGPSFHSRKDAISRTYQYTINNGPQRPAMYRRYHHWEPATLNLDDINEAAQHLVGVHDFRPFASGHPADKSSVRQVYRWEVSARPSDPTALVITCEGSGFMQRQIRRTNAVLLEIGKGRLPVQTISDTLEQSRQGTNNRFIDSIATLPAKGLCLTEVKYIHPW